MAQCLPANIADDVIGLGLFGVAKLGDPTERGDSLRLGREILDVIAERYRQIHAQGFAGRLRIKWIAAHVGTEPMSIRLSLAHLVELAVLGIKPGSGRRPHEYLLALPKRTIAATEAATVESEPAPPF